MPAAPAVPFLILVLIWFTGKRPRAPHQNLGRFFSPTYWQWCVYLYTAFPSLLLQATCISLGAVLCFVSKPRQHPIFDSLFGS